VERRGVLFAQPARLDDAPAARVEAVERALEAGGAVLFGFLRLQHPQRLGVVVGGQIVRRRVRFLVIGVSLEGDLLAGEARLHLEHFLGLDAKLARNARNVVAGHGRETPLHGAQVEEELALGLGGRHLHEPPVAQDVFMDLRLDPVDGKRDQAYPAVGVETLYRLHEPDVALLDEVRVRQPVAEVPARQRHDQPQVRQDEPARRFQVAVALEALGKRALLLGAEDGEAVDGLDVSFEAPRGHRHGHRSSGQGQRCLHGQRSSLGRRF
jgi:hypothetical protein